MRFVTIPGGSFQMGSDTAPHPEDGEGPAREVYVSEFQISATAVSNHDFQRFIESTGYETTAERAGFSLVFMHQLDDPDSHPIIDPAVPWWRKVTDAHWRNPTKIPVDPAFPVVHVSHQDALAYCRWSGTRLPTEAEWERAAEPADVAPHIWQGRFPDLPSGSVGPVAVDALGANRLGLFHMCGNTWEWTADRFTMLHGGRPLRDPKGPLNGSKRVVKGGSFLCDVSYCARYSRSSRRAEHPLTTTGHTGFRVALESGTDLVTAMRRNRE